jgi:soluble lytic murein transglycosylase-like protein
MASRLPEIQRSVIVNPAGIVPIRPAGAEILQQIGVVGQTLQGLGSDLREEDQRRLAEEATNVGLREGAARNPDGTLRPLQLRDTSTAANRAYNKAALTGYSAQYEIDQVGKAAEIRLRHKNDPEGFKAEWAAWRQGQVSQLPTEFQGEAAVLLDRLGSQTYIGAVEDKVQVDLTNQKASWQSLLDAKRIDAGALARQGGISTPAYQRTLSEINGLYDQAVASGWLTDVQAKLDREYLADEHQAQTIVSHAISTAKAAGGGFAARKAAAAELEQVLTDPELRIEPERRAQIVARFDVEMRSTEAARDLEIAGIRDSAKALDTRQAAAPGSVSPSEWMSLSHQARAAGDPLMADTLAAAAAQQSQLSAFVAMPYSDQPRAIGLKQQQLEDATARAATGSGSDVGAGNLFDAVVQVESGGDPTALSPKGAKGAAQIMAATGTDPGFGVTPLKDDSPEENLRFGRDYLNAMLTEFGGNRVLALAAYNAGPGAVDDWIARFGDPRSGQVSDSVFAASIPYPETRAYVGKVLAQLGGPSAEANQLAAELERMRVASKEGAQAFAADPFRVGTEKYKARLGSVPQLDFLAQDLPARLQGRVAQANFINRMEGAYVPPLTAAELDGLAGIVKVAPPDQKAALMKGLAQGLGEQHLAGVMSLLTEKGDQARQFAVAAGIAQSDEAVARDIFAGQEVRTSGTGYVPADDAALRGQLDLYFGQSLVLMRDATARADMVDAALSVYAVDSKNAGDTSGALNEARLLSALDRVTGGLVEFRGQQIFPPRRGMTETEFEDTFDALTAAEVGAIPAAPDGSPITLDDIKDRGVLLSIADGRYAVAIDAADATQAIWDPVANQPWVIDLTGHR